MEPTSQPAPTTPPKQPVVEYVRTNRQNAGYALIAVSLLFLFTGGWTTLKAAHAPSIDTSKEKDKDKEKDKSKDKIDIDSLNLDGGSTKISDPNRTEYIVGAIGSALLFLTIAIGGVWLLVRIPAPGEAQQRTEIRTLLLITGGLAGATLIAFGAAFFYLWIGSLTDWLEKGETKEAKWVLFPLLMVVGGAGLAFASVQPARAEERSNSSLRKLVYGTNMGLSLLLLLIALVVVNVALGRRVPNRLDTTESGFYSLARSSEEFLARLDQPVTAYAILPESGARLTDDIRRLLRTCADVPGTQFKVKFISPAGDRAEHRMMVAKYPVLGVNDYGVLLTFGADEKRHAFIRDDEFAEQQRGTPGGPPPSQAFVGEARLMREMLFLTENQQKAIVYFTQSAGELDLTGVGEQVLPRNSASRLKAFLERNYLEVRPLKFDLANPKVPEDAAVVVVAEPRSPLSEPVVAAIKRYMTQPLPDNRKGKLVVVASARFGPDGKMMRTGLEDLLGQFNIQLTERAVYGAPTRDLDPAVSVVVFAPTAVQARNPVAMALGEKAGFVTSDWRSVGRTTTGSFRAVPLLMTMPGRDTWFETERPVDLDRILLELQTRPEVQVAKVLSENPKVVGVVASEGETGRVAVIGNGTMFSDAVSSQSGGDPVTFDLLSATIDWLRDRPSLGVGVEAKKYKEFTFPVTADETRGLLLPITIVLLVVCGAGAGVWIIRRK